MAYLRCVKIDAPSTHGSIVLEVPNVSCPRIQHFRQFSVTGHCDPAENEGNEQEMYVGDLEYKTDS